MARKTAPRAGLEQEGPASWCLSLVSDEDAAHSVASALQLPPVAGRILSLRGLRTPEAASAHLDLGPSNLHDPFSLPDLRRGAERLCEAIDRGDRIVVHGDYDADGISGTALLTKGLQDLGAVAEAFVPDRQRDGYGVATRLVEHALGAKVRVLVTVDTGSSDPEVLERARAGGIDVIVCDHHLYDEAPDPAVAFINPQRTDSQYPHRTLCGTAVAWKLLLGVHALRGVDAGDRDLDLVALATVADQVPLGPENRTLVRMGLSRMERGARPGVDALVDVCRLRGMSLDAGDLGFQLAPRINAAGRIEHPRTALELLMGQDPAECRRMAARLDDLNRRRRSMQSQLVESARAKAELQLQAGPRAALVLGDESWPFGIVGVGAAQIVGHYGRPAILLSMEGEKARGSARSVDGLDVKAALDQCADLLLRHGGHAGAAGLTLAATRIDEFSRRFDAAVAAQSTSSRRRRLRLDAPLSLAEVEPSLAEFLTRLGPFGPGNPEPRFVSAGLRRAGNPRRVGEHHLRLGLRDSVEERQFIGFSLADSHLEASRSWSTIDVAYTVQYREGSAYDPWQLRMVGLREAGPLAEEGEESSS